MSTAQPTNLSSSSADFVVDESPSPLRRLRVALVTETYPPEVNGVARTVSRVVQGLRESGHDVQVIRPRQGAADAATGGDAEVLTRGMPIPGYPQMRMGLPAGRGLADLWLRRRPDVVYIATEGPLGWSALQAARRIRVPVASEFRTNFHAYTQHYGVGWLQRPMLAYLRKFHNRAHLTMVPTPGLLAELQARRFERLLVVQRGVDTDLFHPGQRSSELRAQWGAGPDDTVVLSVGRLAAEKNLMVTAEAFDAMRRTHPGARMVVVGDGPLRAALQARMPYAHFAGTRSGTDLAAHYASADVFLFPSVTETFGNVTLEAMASGLAVVAYDYAAASQVMRHGENGVLVPKGDDAAFIEAARRLASGAWDRTALAQAAVQSVGQHSWAGVLQQIETALRQLTEGRVPSATTATPWPRWSANPTPPSH